MKITKLLLFTVFLSGFAFTQNPLYIPPTLETTTIDLSLQEGTTEFYPGVISNTMGANGSLLGPTLILNQGDNVSINVDNQLQDTTTIHWHGMHVAPEDDGGPHSVIAPGTIWNPQFQVMDRAGLFWYHPHLHMMTDMHVSKGIAGLIIVRDAEESALTLPRDYGVDDFPLIIQSKGFDAQGEILVHTEMDTSLMINGTVNPYLDVPAQVVRLRVLNGSSQRVYNIGFGNNLPFELIGTDGGLLTAPVNLTRYMISPGQRADILVDLSSLEGQVLNLINFGAELSSGIYGAAQPGMMPQLTLPGYDQNPLNGSDTELLVLQVGPQSASPVLSIPANLVNHSPPVEGTEDISRSLVFTTAQNIVGPFLINGTAFDMIVINYTIPLGNTEIWTLTNQTPISHPFHIHDVQFYILDINGVPPPPEMQGLNDVVLVPAGMGTVRFITKFTDFANDTVPYMYHCHMLTHEDEGMMGQFIVIDPLSGVDNQLNHPFSVYPNPSNGLITVESNAGLGNRLVVTDPSGRLIREMNLKDDEKKVSFRLYEGVYFVQGDSFVRKLIVKP